MTLSLIPFVAILLINILVMGWVVRYRDRTKSGFFLILNAISLIIWAGGQALYKFLAGEYPEVLSLAYLAALLVPGNYLYYALTRPHPLRPSWRGAWGLVAIFAPALLLAALEDYRHTDVSFLYGYTYRIGTVELDTLWRRMTLLYLSAVIASAVAILGIRYYTAAGPEQSIPKHLIASIVGPLMFAAFFWAGSESSGLSSIPSPTFIFIIMAQAGLVAVLRQEELQSPHSLSRPLYYLTVVLVAFVLMNLLSEFYTLVFAGSIVLERTLAWVMVGATLTLLLIARLSIVQRAFDHLIFARAAEYRKVVEETRHELREARERLRKAERMSVVGEVAARVAHEIKNPLGPIRGYAQMMREKVEREPNFAHRDTFLEYLEVISEEVENIDRRVRSFLDTARQTQLLLEPVDLNRMVERCARVLRLELSAGRDIARDMLPIQIEVNLAPDLEPIQADRERIEEAVFNVARNALDALGEQTRGRIVFRTGARARDGVAGVQVSVVDNGPGFPDGNMERYFEPFFTQKDSGTGLGLAIVKSTIEAHGGHIELRNRPLGGGEVVLWLPLVARENPGALLPKPTA